jgi:hypothetical protein
VEDFSVSLFTRLLPIACLLFIQPASADSMRCGSALVSDGAHPGKVLLECGEPLYRDHKTILRSGIPNRQADWQHNGGTFPQYGDSATRRELAWHNRSVVEVPVEVWVYNFGPSALMKEVTFVDGRLTSVKSLGYGK